MPTTTSINETWLTVAEVADRLRVSRRHVYNLIRDGHLPAVMVHADRPPYTQWRLPADQLDEWLDRRTTGHRQWVHVSHNLGEVTHAGQLAGQLAELLAV